MHRGGRQSLRAYVVTSWGRIELECSLRGLTRCRLPPHPRPMSRPPVVRTFSVSAAGREAGFLRAGVEYLARVFRGEDADLPPLDLRGGTAFQRRVWRELMRIHRGSVLTYGELAERIGFPRATRAVGAACRANPLPIFIPCHRVILRCGDLGGYSSGRGWKEILLRIEGFSAAPHYWG